MEQSICAWLIETCKSMTPEDFHSMVLSEYDAILFAEYEQRMDDYNEGYDDRDDRVDNKYRSCHPEDIKSKVIRPRINSPKKQNP